MIKSTLKCPNCGHLNDNNYECNKCGIVFHKHDHLKNLQYRIIYTEEVSPDSEITQSLFYSFPKSVDPINLGINVLIILIIIYYSIYLIPAPLNDTRVGEILLHYVNLVIHEAGHVIFSPFGDIITSLGGSLMQLIIPFSFFLYFLLKERNSFSASVTLWWFGENFLDIAPYIYDASRLELPLLGYESGKEAPYGYHDWNFILTELNLIEYDHLIASVIKFFGVVIMLTSVIWATSITFKMYTLIKLKSSQKS